MSVDLLFMLLFLALGIFMMVQGLPGLLSGELYVRGKYGRGTRYTGNKAIVMGFGSVAFGLVCILNGIFVVTTQPAITTKSPAPMIGLLVAAGVYLVCWIVSWFVNGTAVRERHGSWWSW